MVLDIRKSRELQATVLSLRAADRDIRVGINKQSRTRINPLWRAEVNSRARSTLERRVIGAGVRATASDRGVTLHAATSTRALRGGLVPYSQWQGAEFGAAVKVVTVRQRSRKGNLYSRPLTVNRQFDSRSSNGQVAMRAASETGTKLVALWVDTTIDAYRTIPAIDITGR